MFSGQIDVRRLLPNEIKKNWHVVADINYLLRQQHGGAIKIEEETLLANLKQSKVVVAWKDDRVVGVGQLVKVPVLSHSFASIHNLVIRRGTEVTSTGSQIVNLLTADLSCAEFVEAGAWDTDCDLINILTVAGFRKRDKHTFRYLPPKLNR